MLVHVVCLIHVAIIETVSNKQNIKKRKFAMSELVSCRYENMAKEGKYQRSRLDKSTARRDAFHSLSHGSEMIESASYNRDECYQKGNPGKGSY